MQHVTTTGEGKSGDKRRQSEKVSVLNRFLRFYVPLYGCFDYCPCVTASFVSMYVRCDRLKYRLSTSSRCYALSCVRGISIVSVRMSVALSRAASAYRPP